MITEKELKFGSYQQYEGYYHLGTAKYTLPDNPSPGDMVLSVVTKTEGGTFNSCNQYDSCLTSVGLIQYCQRFFLVSDLLGFIVDQLGAEILSPLDTAMAASQATFQKNAHGRYRWFINGVEVTTPQQHQQLLFAGGSGLKGSWGAEGSVERTRSKQWAVGFVNTLGQPQTFQAQADFTAPKIKGFAMAEAKALLWGSEDPGDEALGWVGGLRAAFLSFAANNPTIAQNQLKAGVASTNAPKWSPDWCITILRQMTFGPKMAIYPGRYDKVRGQIEQLYGIDLPDFAPDLQAWHEEMGVDPASTAPSFTTVKEYQALLLAEGYDLGPAGADGKDGPKTRDAVRVFQGLHGLTADGIVGAQTRAAFATEWRKRNG